MHDCFLVDEILRVIVRNVDNSDSALFHLNSIWLRLANRFTSLSSRFSWITFPDMIPYSPYFQMIIAGDSRMTFQVDWYAMRLFSIAR